MRTPVRVPPSCAAASPSLDVAPQPARRIATAAMVRYARGALAGNVTLSRIGPPLRVSTKFPMPGILTPSVTAVTLSSSAEVENFVVTGPADSGTPAARASARHRACRADRRGRRLAGPVAAVVRARREPAGAFG